MTTTIQAAFIKSLKAQHNNPSDHHKAELCRLCGAVWNDTAEMPSNERWIVRDLIPSWIDADEWEAKGRTYSGAARLIRPTLKGDDEMA